VILQKSQNVREIAIKRPATVRVFETFGIELERKELAHVRP
jgi:hypothetical protein